MLRPEVAAHFELTHGTTRLRVPRLGREVDLTRIDVAEAEELLALPGGFEWLRRRPAPELPAAPGPPAPEPAPAGQKPARQKRGARGSNHEPH